MTSYAEPFLCVYCARTRDLTFAQTCDAFPDGIPGGIILNEVDHRQPVEGDHGLQFERDHLFGAEKVEAMIPLMGLGEL